jgi:hypothetical protein
MDVRELLKHDVIEVEFTKRDGTNRVMKCTLKDDMIPTEHAPKGTSEVKANTDVISVFDVDNQGWRSFSCDSIIKVKYRNSDSIETIAWNVKLK